MTGFEQRDLRAVLKEDAESVTERLIQTIAKRWPVLKKQVKSQRRCFRVHARGDSKKYGYQTLVVVVCLMECRVETD